MLSFSVNEKRDLFKAWVAISLAVSILELRGIPAGLGFKSNLALIIQAFVIYAATVGVAFLAHEVLGHKLLAQRYRLFAEFWADDFLLMVALLSSFFGFVFAAPGAVVISGVTRVDTYGKVAAAGPLVNIILAIVLGILLRMVDGFVLPYPLPNLLALGYSFNSWFALFNLFPFGVLDGAKIFAWDKRVWGVMIAVAVLLFLGII